MEIIYTPDALDDLKKIKKSGNNATKKRLERILLSICETPFEGFASPEQLKNNLAGKWSRELSKKDRVVYEVQNNTVSIYSLLGHYNDK
jgi:toxin YoeB